MNKLSSVVEAILDPAASEWLAINIETESSVQAYADVAMGLMLNDDEAAAVHNAIKEWLSNENKCADGFFHAMKALDA